jgi:cytochrome c oxidase subunit 2
MIIRQAVFGAAFLALVLAPGAAWAAEGAKFWFPESVSSYGHEVDRIFTIILWITGAIFLLVEGALLLFLFKYRAKPGQRAFYFHGSHVAEVIWTIIPALIVAWLGFASQRVWARIRGTPPPHQLEVKITAQQFAWNVTYAGADGKLGTPDDLLTINQLHFPVNQVVLVHLTSQDVIHSFFLPEFRIKQDAVPWLTSRLWLQATKEGTFEVVCAELCGLGHYRLRGYLVVESPEAFQTWLQEVQAEQGT